MDIRALLKEELGMFRVESVRNLAESVLLDEPRIEERGDRYTKTPVSVVIVADTVSGLSIAYRPRTEQYVSRYQWGAVDRSGCDLGMDGAWYNSLEEAYYACDQDCERPENYEVG
jgi:hypothetical protein